MELRRTAEEAVAGMAVAVVAEGEDEEEGGEGEAGDEEKRKDDDDDSVMLEWKECERYTHCCCCYYYYHYYYCDTAPLIAASAASRVRRANQATCSSRQRNTRRYASTVNSMQLFWLSRWWLMGGWNAIQSH